MIAPYLPTYLTITHQTTSHDIPSNSRPTNQPKIRNSFRHMRARQLAEPARVPDILRHRLGQARALVHVGDALLLAAAAAGVAARVEYVLQGLVFPAEDLYCMYVNNSVCVSLDARARAWGF